MPDAELEAAALAVFVSRGRLGEEPRPVIAAIREVLAGAGAGGIEEDETEDGWFLYWSALPTDVVKAAEAVRERFGWHPAVSISVASEPGKAQQLALRGPERLIAIDALIYDKVRGQVLRHSGHTTDYLVTGKSSTSASLDWQSSVETAAAVIGALAGLTVWVAVVGGAIMWARLHRADVPETQGVAVLPRDLLLGVGLHVVIVMLAFAIPLGLIALFVSLKSVTELRQAKRKAKPFFKLTGRGLVVAGLGFVFGYLAFSRWFDVQYDFVAYIMGVAGFALVSLWAALDRLKKRSIARSLAVFGIVFAAAGVIGALREFGSRSVRLDRAELMLKTDAGPRDALFIARSTETLYVARSGADGSGCRIDVIPTDMIRELRIREYRRKDAGCTANGQQTAGGSTTTITQPGETVTVSEGTVTIAPEIVTLPAERVTVEADPVTVIETREVERPAGAHRLEDGQWAIPVASVRPPLRLAISAPAYSRSPLRDTSPLKVTFRVTAVPGYVVEGARIFVRALRSSYFRPAEAQSDRRGYAVICLHPSSNLPFDPRARIALFVRAWNPAEPILAGVSQRRLVQLNLGPRVAPTTAGDC